MDLLRAFEGPALDGGEGFDLFFVVFGIAVAIVLAGFVFVGYTMVRSARAAKRAGIDPFTPPAVLMAQAVRGGAGRSLEQRLTELDDLHRRGVISTEEHAAARRKALEG